jgi:hypothetical protein
MTNFHRRLLFTASILRYVSAPSGRGGFSLQKNIPRRASAVRSAFKKISHATLRNNIFGLGRVLLDFFPQPPDGNVNGPQVAQIIVLPDLAQELFP